MTLRRVRVHQAPQVLNASASTCYMETDYSAFGAGVQVNATVNSAGTQTANYGVLAAGTLGGVTYTAKADPNGKDSNGNNITVAYTTGGTAGSEVVTVVGTAISVQIQSGVSTITQVRTAINASTPAAALVVATGTSATTVSAPVAATALNAMSTPTTGVDSAIAINTTGAITATAHGLFSGQVVTLTTSAGSLPTGLATSTNYYVYVIDANTIQLFDTAAHVLAVVSASSPNKALVQSSFTNGYVSSATGVIVPTVDGSSGAHMSVIPTSISGASYKLQWSNDYVPALAPGGSAIRAGNWIDYVSGETHTQVTNTITTSASSGADIYNVAGRIWFRVTFAISAGSMLVECFGKSL